MGRICKQIIVSGHVQGVFFRNWTVKTASAVGITGWVRNRNDGTVEALICGEEPDIATMIDRMRSGPERARVDAIDVEDADASPPDDFQKRPTV